MRSEIPFCTFLSYAPRGSSVEAVRSRRVVADIKYDRIFPGIGPIIEYTARRIHEEDPPELRGVLDRWTTLVPVPKVALMKPDTLWVPKRLCEALLSEGMAFEILPCLRRERAMVRSAGAAKRPSPEMHYDSLKVERNLELAPPKKISLVDDVITRGATMLAAYSRMAEAFPGAEINAFAVVRTISDETDFEETLSPCAGTVVYHGGNSLTRSP